MAYNFALKEFANGTLQLTYYDYPVLDAFDKNVISFENSFYNSEDRFIDEFDDDCPWGDAGEIIRDLGEKELDELRKDMEILSDEEIKKRHERCLKSSLNRSVHKIYDLLGVQTTLVETTIHHHNGGALCIVWGCNGIKQSFIFTMIMLFARGPMKHKLWFIPLGLLCVYLINISRLLFLAYIVRDYPNSFEFWHSGVTKYVLMVPFPIFLRKSSWLW